MEMIRFNGDGAIHRAVAGAALLAAGCQPASERILTRRSGYGWVQLSASAGNSIVALQTTLKVPATPPPSGGGVSLWPGLQPLPPPSGVNFEPIGAGVLQPVLNWGDTCAPGHQPSPFSTWWVSATYVNTTGDAGGHTGCFGGPVMAVEVGDSLQMTITLQGTVWHQTVVDSRSGMQVTFDEDLEGQSQNTAIFAFEEFVNTPSPDATFTDTTMTWASPDSGPAGPALA